jgi:hypothetical protein
MVRIRSLETSTNTTYSTSNIPEQCFPHSYRCEVHIFQFTLKTEKLQSSETSANHTYTRRQNQKNPFFIVSPWKTQIYFSLYPEKGGDFFLRNVG